MRVLGLDQGTGYTGWCVVEDGQLKEYGVIRIPEHKDIVMKIIMMAHDVTKLVRKYDPDELCLEDIYYRFYNAFKALAMLRGALIWDWWLLKLTTPIIVGCTTARVKLGMKGNAKKPEIIEYLNKRYNLTLQDEHVADAIVVALVGYDMAVAAMQKGKDGPKGKGKPRAKRSKGAE